VIILSVGEARLTANAGLNLDRLFLIGRRTKLVIYSPSSALVVVPRTFSLAYRRLGRAKVE
jgi:hypothetical protein